MQSSGCPRVISYFQKEIRTVSLVRFMGTVRWNRRILTVVDEFTSERLETYVNESISTAKVIEVLAFLFLRHDPPAYLRRDNPLADARWTIEAYRCYFNEQRLHGARGYVPSAEFKQQWPAEHPTAPGALLPNPGFIAFPIRAERAKGKPAHLDERSGFCSDGRPTFRLRPHRALFSGRRPTRHRNQTEDKTFTNATN